MTRNHMCIDFLAVAALFVGAALALFILLAGAPAQATPLWTPAELAARPGEDHAGRRGQPDLAPPARTEPKHVLAPLPSGLRGSIRRVDTGGEKLVALTFDLCELSDQRTGYAGAIVDFLRSESVPATFFAGGKWMRSHPERAMQLMSDPLFEVGSHAWTHGNFGVLDPGRMREQIIWTQAQYELLREELTRLAGERGAHAAQEQGDPVRPVANPPTGAETAGDNVPPSPGFGTTRAGEPRRDGLAPESIRVFRFPYGRCRAEALDLLASLGIAAIQWDVNMMDAASTRTAQAVARDVERGVKPGSIVLGHANGFGHDTAEALRIIVPALKAKGFRFVTVSTLLASGKAVTAPDCFDSRPGDTHIYDAQFGDGTIHPKRK